MAQDAQNQPWPARHPVAPAAPESLCRWGRRCCHTDAPTGAGWAPGRLGQGSTQGRVQLPWVAIPCGGGSAWVPGVAVAAPLAEAGPQEAGVRERPATADGKQPECWSRCGSPPAPAWPPGPLVNSACTALPGVQTGRHPVPCLGAPDAHQAEEGTEALGGGGPGQKALGLSSLAPRPPAPGNVAVRDYRPRIGSGDRDRDRGKGGGRRLQEAPRPDLTDLTPPPRATTFASIPPFRAPLHMHLTAPHPPPHTEPLRAGTHAHQRQA